MSGLARRHGSQVQRIAGRNSLQVFVPGTLADGCGVRQTSRLVGVGKDTVVRYGLLAGGHARQLHDELVGFSPLHHQGAAR